MHRSRTPQFAGALFAILALAAAAFARQQQPADVATAPVSPAPYRVGEKLTYTVSFSNFTVAAHTSLYVAGRGNYFGREGVELRAHVRTVGEVSAALLKLNNYYFSFVDPATGQPHRAQSVQGDSLAFAGVLSAAGTPPIDVVTIPTPADAETAPGGFDFVSALFRLRALPLAPGARFRFTARHAGSQYDAELRVGGRENVNTPAGSFNALVATVRVPKNDAADDHRVTIYFTDDERHVPVLITARLPAGEVRAALASDETVAPVHGEQGAGQPGTAPTPTLPADPSLPDPNARPTPRPAVSPTPAAGGQAPAGLPFEVGEQLNFNFYLGNSTQPVGTASFQVRSRGTFYNRDGMLLTATMSTNQTLQNVFPVRDVISSYVDARTLLPFRNELQIQEGSHRLQGIVTLDQERGGALLPDGANIEIPVGTYDLVSVLYA
ncbi:MAG: DUF3108 domain-containing protein, partial [Acidobacteria bacterium]|nr:DUF3108 domain-containing protein [Acidobacteriota bacterium]